MYLQICKKRRVMSRYMKIIVPQIALILLSITFVGCGSCQSRKEVDLGGLNQGVYINNYFGFTMGVPDSWKILNTIEIESLKNQAKSKVGNDVSEESGFLNLFFGGEYDEEIGYKCSLLITAQNIKENPDLADASKYLVNSVEELRQLYGGFMNSFPITMEPISGESFYTIRYDIKTPDDLEFSQMLLVVIRNDYLLSFILTYDNQFQYQDLRNALDSLKFAEKE